MKYEKGLKLERKCDIFFRITSGIEQTTLVLTGRCTITTKLGLVATLNIYITKMDRSNKIFLWIGLSCPHKPELVTAPPPEVK